MWANSSNTGHLNFMHSNVIPSGPHVFLRTMTSRMAWTVAEVAVARGYGNFKKFDEMLHMMNLAVLHKTLRTGKKCVNLRSETRVSDSWYMSDPISSQITDSLYNMLDIGNEKWAQTEDQADRVHRIRRLIIGAFDRVRSNLEQMGARTYDKDIKLRQVTRHLEALRPLEGDGILGSATDVMRAAVDAIVADIVSHSRRELWHETHQCMYLLNEYEETYAQLDSGAELYEPLIDTAITALYVSLVSDRLMRVSLSKNKDDDTAADFIRTINDTELSLNKILEWNDSDAEVVGCRIYYTIMKYCKRHNLTVKHGIDQLLARILSTDVPSEFVDELTLLMLAAKRDLEYKHYLTDVVRVLLKICSAREAATLRPLVNGAAFMRATTLCVNNAAGTEALTYILTDATNAAGVELGPVLKVWRTHVTTCSDGQQYGNYLWMIPEWLQIADKLDFSLLII